MLACLLVASTSEPMLGALGVQSNLLSNYYPMLISFSVLMETVVSNKVREHELNFLMGCESVASSSFDTHRCSYVEILELNVC